MSISPLVQHLINDIRNDRTHGASELARQSLEALKTAAGQSKAVTTEAFFSEMDEVGNRLLSVRPAMAPIYNMVKRLLASLDDHKNSDVIILKAAAANQADELIASSVNAAGLIAGYTVEMISEKAVVMTHSYSSTVATTLKKAYEKKHIQAMVTRSGASRVGQRMVWEIGYAGVRTTYFDDTAMGLYIPNVACVLVGADRICADGGVVNGVGTYLLALAAERAKVPFYVLCEIAKFDPRLKSGDIEIEEKPGSELAPAGILPEGVIIKNPYFDTTPLELISGIITEDGLVKREDILAYIQKLAFQLS
jgi:eIF-2B alpha/beta/delta-like uncharacterized protein